MESFENLKKLMQDSGFDATSSKGPSLTSEHKDNLEKMREFQKIHNIDPKKSSYQIPGDFEKDEKGEAVMTRDPKTGKLEPKPHYTPYSEIARRPNALKNVMEDFHQPLAVDLAKGRKEYDEKSATIPEDMMKNQPVTSRVLSHKSFDEMDDKDRNMFKTLYSEATKEPFMGGNLKENIAASKEEQGEKALFIEDWSNAIKTNKGLREAITDVIPDALIANTSEKEDPEVMANYLYQASDGAIGKIQQKLFDNALRQIIRYKKDPHAYESKPEQSSEEAHLVPKVQNLTKKPEPTGDESKPLDISKLFGYR